MLKKQPVLIFCRQHASVPFTVLRQKCSCRPHPRFRHQMMTADKMSSFLTPSLYCKPIRTIGSTPCPELYIRLQEPEEQSCSGSQPTVEYLEMSTLVSLPRRGGGGQKGTTRQQHQLQRRRRASSGHSQCQDLAGMTVVWKVASCPGGDEHRSQQTE